jgi:hypothetical protein
MHKRIEQQETYMAKHDRAWLHVLVRYAYVWISAVSTAIWAWRPSKSVM